VPWQWHSKLLNNTITAPRNAVEICGWRQRWTHPRHRPHNLQCNCLS
jgi:hypothetical protein